MHLGSCNQKFFRSTGNNVFFLSAAFIALAKKNYGSCVRTRTRECIIAERDENLSFLRHQSLKTIPKSFRRMYFSSIKIRGLNRRFNFRYFIRPGDAVRWQNKKKNTRDEKGTALRSLIFDITRSFTLFRRYLHFFGRVFFFFLWIPGGELSESLFKFIDIAHTRYRRPLFTRWLSI